MEQGAFVIQELTGDWPVYPGHPLVLATAIMRVFPTFADANNPTDHGWSAALADSRIPGAGDHVGAAMRTLELGSRGANADAMVAYATRYWEAGQAGGHIKNVDAGKTQAEKVEPHFRAMSEQWFKTAETSERKANGRSMGEGAACATGSNAKHGVGGRRIRRFSPSISLRDLSRFR